MRAPLLSGLAAAAALVVLLTLPPTLRAQRTPELAAGTRVRITAPPFGLHGTVGVVEAGTSDTLLVLLEGETSVRRLEGLDPQAIEFSSHRTDRRGTGFVVGAVAGGLLEGCREPASRTTRRAPTGSAASSTCA